MMTDADELRRIAGTLDNFLDSDADVLVGIAARLDAARCNTCRWWVETDKECGRVGTPLKIAPPGSPVILQLDDDAQDCQAILCTPPDFGCVQWEAKE
jgi:hypothetical protein